MSHRPLIKSLALTGLAALAIASTGCSVIPGQAAYPPVNPPADDAMLVAYDTEGVHAFSLVASDQVGFFVFADTLVAQSLDPEFGLEDGAFANVDSIDITR